MSRMNERRYSPLCRADHRAGQGVPPRAGGDVLGLLLPGAARRGPGLRLPREGAGQDPGRRRGGLGGGPGARRTAEALARARRCSSPASSPPAEGREALRTGRISLLVEPGPPVVFRFDETRPDSRIARLEADDALQRAAGRKDVVAVRAEKVTEKGSRYIDFLIPGLLGMNLMGTGIWSLAFSVTTARSRADAEAPGGDADAQEPLPAGQILGRLGFLLPEIAVLVGARLAPLRRRGARLAPAARSSPACSAP